MSTNVDTIIRQLMVQMVEDSYVHAGEIVKLTGKYAVSLTAAQEDITATTLKTFLKNSVVVEIKSADPDIGSTQWIKMVDLYKVSHFTEEVKK